ncbi:MAG: hypothetical protein V3U74_04460 [Thermodesulfobacteriota bacterium]
MRRKVYFYKAKASPLAILAVLLGLIVLAAISAVMVVAALVIGACIAGAMLVRRLFASKSSEFRRLEDDGRTVVLREDEYEVLDK